MPDCDDIVFLAEIFKVYISSKVEMIHRQISENNCQQYQSAEKHTSSSLRCLPLITKTNVSNIVKSVKCKSCLLGPTPTVYLERSRGSTGPINMPATEHFYTNCYSSSVNEILGIYANL